MLAQSRRRHSSILDELSADAFGCTRDLLVADHPPNGGYARRARALPFVGADEAQPSRRYEPPGSHELHGARPDQLLKHAHLLEDVERGLAPGVAASLVPRKSRFLE